MVRRKESVDVLVKRFKNGKIVWDRVIKLQMNTSHLFDYTMDEQAVYLMSWNNGLFSYKFKIVSDYPEGHDRSCLVFNRFERFTVNGPLNCIYEDLKHLRGGLDESGFHALLIFTYIRKGSSSKALAQFSWLKSFMSDCQEILRNHILQACASNEAGVEWSNFSQFGCALWIKSSELFTSTIESVCKLSATKTLSKNIDLISIFYACLKKDKLLVALWRASHHPDSEKIVSFLQTPPSKERVAIAEKSAFVLLSKQREHLAIFFFVLIGRHTDAIKVALDRLGDICLAVSISRLTGTSLPEKEFSEIENFLVDSLGKVDNFRWDLLLQTSKQYQTYAGWTLPKASIKQIMKSKGAVADFTADDVKELWRDGLFEESVNFINSLKSDEDRRRLLYEASTLSVMLLTGVTNDVQI
jgi:hypothetical protein